MNILGLTLFAVLAVFAAGRHQSQDFVHIPKGFPFDKLKEKSFRIVNGEEAEMHEFPFMAMLTYWDGWQFCGASLIDEQYVLTAAHCVVGLEPDQIRVRLGDHNKYTDEETDHQELRVAEIIVHEEYDDWILKNDIALLRLEDKAERNHQVDQICLPPYDHFEDQPSIVMGWGTTSSGGSSSGVLLKVNQVIWSNRACAEAIAPYGFDHAIYHGSICAFGVGKDACQGDSGGPLVLKNKDGYYHQIGIVSWGVGCATDGVPGVYTRVTHFTDWIVKNAKGALLCG